MLSYNEFTFQHTMCENYTRGHDKHQLVLSIMYEAFTRDSCFVDETYVIPKCSNTPLNVDR